MDKKDQRLLTELTLNSRIPINQLAKKVGISREVASYRINRLIKEKIIKEFYTVINTDFLGFSRFVCFFQLKGISSEGERKFTNYLINHDFVTYIGPVIGKWNVVFDILARDRNHLETIVKEITNYIPNHVESYVIIDSGTEHEMFPTKTFGIKKEIHYKDKAKKIKIDKIDLKILELISPNSRVEYKELSKKLSLTGNAIKYRIKKLEKSGIIQGYTISVNLRKLGFELYNIQLKLKENKEQQLKQFLRENFNVIYFYRYLGSENWDIDVGVITKDSLELRDFILELREKFGNIIKIYDMYIILEETKGNYAPKGVFD